ncbi:MAG: dihydrolipoamide acetyltransferase family protein [Negativicutes bacterium]|nr:dihydrolipoamide acetyltransferase family protein [Negativicutes bacterium]
MAVEFIMPQLGLTMTEGTVARWLKKIGETVTAGEVFAEVATDKISVEVEATASGTILEILVAEGETVPVKAVLAIIGEPGEKAAVIPAVSAPPVAESLKAPQEAVVAADTGEWVKASPLARKLARERGLDLAGLTGTGPDGRIIERDILSHSAPDTAVKATPLAAKIAAEHGLDLTALPQSGRIMKQDVLDALPMTPAAVGTPLSGMRKVIAERMTGSWQTCPHVHHTVEVDMLASLQLKDKFAQTGAKLSLTELIVKCTAKALTEFPMVNNALVDGRLVVNEAVNIGVAVALDSGLIVPVVKNADQKTLAQLRADIADLGGRARQGKLLPDEYSGGTFTVSNLGMYGVDHFTPIINPPESGILGVCRTVERPVVVGASIVIRPMMNLCLGYNHQVVDGALAGRFTARLRQLLEQPLLLL